MRLNSSSDPRRFELYAASRVENELPANAARARKRRPTPAAPLAITKIGDSVYEMSPMRPLYPGEYSLSTIDSNESYCFGVNY